MTILDVEELETVDFLRSGSFSNGISLRGNSSFKEGGGSPMTSQARSRKKAMLKQGNEEPHSSRLYIRVPWNRTHPDFQLRSQLVEYVMVNNMNLHSERMWY